VHQQRFDQLRRSFVYFVRYAFSRHSGNVSLSSGLFGLYINSVDDFSCGKISIWQRGRKKKQRGRKKKAKIKTIKILLRENFYSFSKEENVLRKKHIVERTNLHFSRKPSWDYKGVYFVYFGYIYFSVCKNSIKREVFAPGYS